MSSGSLYHARGAKFVLIGRPRPGMIVAQLSKQRALLSGLSDALWKIRIRFPQLNGYREKGEKARQAAEE